MNFVKYSVVTSVITAIMMFFHCVFTTSDPGETTLPILPDLHTEGVDTDPTGTPSCVAGDTVVFSITLESSAFTFYYLRIDGDMIYSFDAAESASKTFRISYVFTTPGEKRIILQGKTEEGVSLYDTLQIKINGLPPTIIRQPHDTTLSCGDSIALALTVTGTPEISYAWYKEDDLSDKDSLLSSDSLQFFDSLVQNDSGTYYCIVENDYGSSDTSKPITLTVIGEEIVDTSVVSFSIVLSGDDTVYPATEVSIISHVSDDVSGERTDLAATTHWRVLELDGQSEEALKQRIGQTVTFIPEVTYSTVVIEGYVFDGGDTLRDTVRFYIAPCKAYQIQVDVSPDDTVCPYTAVSLLCTVSDDSIGERADLAEKTEWRIIDLDGQSENTLKKSVGQSVTFVPNVAYSRVSIEGAVFEGRNTLRDTVHLYIKPCEAYKIYIEPFPVDTASDTLVLRYPQEFNHITIPENIVHSDAYAVARDSSGAFVRLADSITTQWRISDDGISLVQAMGETDRKYHGVITRITDGEGQTYLIGEEPGLLGDSVIVSIALYYIVRIQLRDATGLVVDTIRMYSDETRTYEVWGLKSTMVDQPDYPESWVRINVVWNFSDEPHWRTSPPSLAHSWVADPTTTGEGALTLTNPGDQRSEMLVIPVIVAVRSLPDTAVSLQIITAPPRYAGDTIMAQVNIFNSDALIPGTYCFGTGGDDPYQAVYSDVLGTGGNDCPLPVLMVNGVDTVLNVQNASQFSVNQCFENGIDTIRFILYYAPYSTDSLHQISLTLGPNLVAHTQSFTLLPSSLDSIRIEDANLNTVPPIALTGSESVTLYSDGYDTYGNRIGFITTSWTTTGTLGSLQEESTNVYYTADGITYDQAGTICASAFRVDSSIIKSCLPVNITGLQK